MNAVIMLFDPNEKQSVQLHDKSAIFYSVENAHGPWPFCSWERRSLRVH